MRIDEIYKPIKDEMPYDVPSDVHFHMLNDDGFYRKHYLPCMEKIRSERNEKVIQGHLMPMIDKCVYSFGVGLWCTVTAVRSVVGVVRRRTPGAWSAPLPQANLAAEKPKTPRKQR